MRTFAALNFWRKMNSNIQITPIQNSRIDSVDFNNLPFGTLFSDHMFTCDFKEGKWQNPTIKSCGIYGITILSADLFKRLQLSKGLNNNVFSLASL